MTDQKSRTLSALDDFHSRHPYKKGFPADELRHQLGLSAPLFDFLSEALKVEGRIDVAQGIVRRHGFRIELNEGDKVLAQTVERELKEAAFTPPTVDTLAGNLGLADSRMLQILHVLKDQGKAVDVARDLWFHGDSLISMENDVRAFLREHSSLAVSDFKTMTRTTRKHAIPLLEYLDKRKVTRREGDSRVLWS
ncbi:MAG: SelB C-terminal domain-containing protein [Fidelibacterota bacterium]